MASLTGPLVKRIDDDWIKDLRDLKEYANRKRFLAWQRWNEAWRIYNNQYDFSAKASWQSKNFVPKVGMTVEMAASLVRRAMLDAEHYFRYEGTTETSKQMAPFLEKIAYWYLDQLRFVDNFVPPLKAGFVGSLIILKPHLAPYVLKDETEEDVEKRLRGEKVEREIIEGPAITVSYPDPYNIWLDPTGRKMFVLEEEEMDYATANDLVDMGVLDGDVLKKIQEDWVETDKQAFEEQRKQQQLDTTRPSFRTQLKLTHFWGSLPIKNKGWAIRNGHFVMANDKYLIRKPMDNPYAHKQIPYVIGSPFRRPFSVYHKGLVEDVVGLAKSMTELLNLGLDSTLFSSIRAFEVDLDQIEDPQEILNGIYPGKMFKARKGGQDTQMIRDIEIKGVNKDLISMYQQIGTEYQNHTAVTEFISGAASASPGRTATEIVNKQQQGMGIFSEIARNLEGTVLEPFLEQMASLIVDYHEDFMSPDIVEILGNEMAMQLMLETADTRMKLFEPNKMRVHASGITSLLNRTEEIQKIQSLMQTLGQFGQMLPMMMQGIDPGYFFSNLFKKMIHAFGWNEADIIRPGQQPPAGGASPGAGPTGQPPGSPPLPSPQEGLPAPAEAPQLAGQIAQIRQAVSGGGLPPSGR